MLVSSQDVNYRVQDCKEGRKLTTWEGLEVTMKTKSLFIKYDGGRLESPSLATELKTRGGCEW